MGFTNASGDRIVNGVPAVANFKVPGKIGPFTNSSLNPRLVRRVLVVAEAAPAVRADVRVDGGGAVVADAGLVAGDLGRVVRCRPALCCRWCRGHLVSGAGSRQLGKVQRRPARCGIRASRTQRAAHDRFGSTRIGNP